VSGIRGIIRWIQIGEYSLWLALAGAVWALAAAVRDAIWPSGARKSAERAVYLCGLGVATASGTLVAALITGELSLQYVAALTAWNVPLAYRVAALWGAPPGTLLVAALALTSVTPVALHAARVRAADTKSWFIVAVAVTLVLLLAPLISQPGLFAALDFVPAEGLGLDPKLQVPEMLFYSPLTVIGFGAALVAAAIAIAGIASRRLDGVWLALVRRWTAIAWAAQTIALFAVLHWSFISAAGQTSIDWRAEPIRNGAFAAWLIVTLTLAIVATLERRGTAPGWLASFVVADLVAIALPALVTRNPAGPSARAFLAAPIGNWSLIFAAVLVGSVGYLGSGVRTARFAARSPKRRVPLAIAVVGAVLAAAGIAAFSRATRTDVTIADGASVRVRDAFNTEWTFASSGTSVYKFMNRYTTATALIPSHGGSRGRLIRTETREFLGGDEQPMGEPLGVPGVSHSLLQDAVVVLRAAPPGRALLTIAFIPLASFTWMGGALLLFGVLLTTRGTTSMAELEAEDPAEAAVKRWRARKVECPDCGPRPESVAMFCSNCGRFLENECPRCHAAVHASDARFCENCGTAFGG
jgi:cytochrome c biogenesis factor